MLLSLLSFHCLGHVDYLARAEKAYALLSWGALK